MAEKDWNRLAAYEKAISKKYGKETIQNPKSNWDDDKEKDYVEQQKELYLKEQKRSEYLEKIEHDGVLISKKLLNRDSKVPCPTCDKMFFKSMDDVCMIKYECCFGCFIKYVEGREERWKEGWRPNENYEKKN
jgi:hypothetical protein